VQIFTGVVEKLTPMKGWLNIFNPTFTLHLLEETIAETWVTRKPTADVNATCLGLLTAECTPVTQLYGPVSYTHRRAHQTIQDLE
ncbi:hypothetical protein JQN32_26045, partial [Escherichia coli]|nr:hypothetical protein [Escherichia coli]